MGTKSETALRTRLTICYPRKNYILTDKLTTFLFKKQEDLCPLFKGHLAVCGIECFDFYLMCAQNRANFELNVTQFQPVLSQPLKCCKVLETGRFPVSTVLSHFASFNRIEDQNNDQMVRCYECGHYCPYHERRIR